MAFGKTRVSESCNATVSTNDVSIAPGSKAGQSRAFGLIRKAREKAKPRDSVVSDVDAAPGDGKT